MRKMSNDTIMQANAASERAARAKQQRLAVSTKHKLVMWIREDDLRVLANDLGSLLEVVSAHDATLASFLKELHEEVQGMADDETEAPPL